MKWLVLFVVFSFFLIIVYNCWKFRNPYKLFLVFGPKGVGKTTLITKLTFKYLKKGRKVYSTTWVPGVYYFDAVDIGSIHFEPNSVVFCDEAGIVFDNRDFKTFSKGKRDFFKYQRQYRVTLYLFSQAFDVDKKIRDLTDYLYIMTNFLNCISLARRIKKAPKIVQSPSDGSDTIGEKLEFAPIWLWPFGGCHVTWIPHWVKYFKSFNPPELPEGEFIYVDAVEDENVLSRVISLVGRCRDACRFRFKALPFYQGPADAPSGEADHEAEEGSGW